MIFLGIWQNRLISAVIIFSGVTISDQQSNCDRYRFDCFPKPNPTESECTQRGCQWDGSPAIPTAPKCYIDKYTGIHLRMKNVSGNYVELEDSNTTSPSPSLFSLEKRLYGVTLNIRIQPTPNNTKRFEPDIGLHHDDTTSSDSLWVEMHDDPMFSFLVKRVSSNETLWASFIGGGVYFDLLAQLPSGNLYGFGEHAHLTLRHDMERYTTWGMMARDEGPNSHGLDTKNLYGVHPFYMCVENTGKAHGVLIINSNPQEVSTGPAKTLVYRTIGGMIDMYFFPGPTPEEVVKQYEVLVGKPTMPAYWALGFQLARYGYQHLEDQKAAIKRTQGAGIPLDAPNFDIDYMNRYMDFTTGEKWKDLGIFVKELHEQGMHAVLIFDPAIDVTSDAFKRAREKGAAFVEWPTEELVPRDIQDLYETTNDTKIMLGVVWPDHHTAFPDFSDLENNTVEWWVEEYKLYHEQVAFDGIWIDMNEPANFGTNEDIPWYFNLADHPNITSLKCNNFSEKDRQYDYPPYQTQNVNLYKEGASLASKTLCMLGTTRRGAERLFDTKNLYGLYEAKATMKALHESTGKRGIVVSRSTFPTAGRYSGHWLGDNQAAWPALMTSIVGVQEMNMFGIPYVGSDICGYAGNTTEELCLRWQQLGAFHSFSRNHNNNNANPQDPAQWPSVANATRQALLFRYRYLPYLYSLHFVASHDGGTVVRPVFFEFPYDNKTLDLGKQFMWGSGMMIVPVVEEGAKSVDAYLPETATWYSMRDADYGTLSKSGTFHATTDELIPVFARGGVIIPRQAPGLTTTASRKNPFELLIAIDPSDNTAHGILFWDDGESIIDDFETHSYHKFDFSFAIEGEVSTLDIVRNSKGEMRMPTLDNIHIFGISHEPDFKNVKLNGEVVEMLGSTYDAPKMMMKIEKVEFIELISTSSLALTLTWTNKQHSATAEPMAQSDASPTTTRTKTSFSPNLNACPSLLSLISAAYLLH